MIIFMNHRASTMRQQLSYEEVPRTESLTERHSLNTRKNSQNWQVSMYIWFGLSFVDLGVPHLLTLLSLHALHPKSVPWLSTYSMDSHRRVLDLFKLYYKKILISKVLCNNLFNTQVITISYAKKIVRNGYLHYIIITINVSLTSLWTLMYVCWSVRWLFYLS